MIHDVAIVGAGLFGATIARSLRKRGISTLVFDDARPFAGSLASGSLMKPSWFDGLGKDVYEPALAELHDVYSVRELEFTIAPKLFKSKVLWVPTHEILALEDVIAEKVVDIRPGMVRTETGGGPFANPPGNWKTYEARRIVVAAGHWCRELLHEVQVEGKAGLSFRWTDASTANTINPWAPYKQMVRFTEEHVMDQRNPSIWAGDGTAIHPDNLTGERQQQSCKRVIEWVRDANPLLDHGPVATLGIRPYCPGVKPALLREVRPCVWVATGGAKNGLIGAGWVARKLAEAFS